MNCNSVECIVHRCKNHIRKVFFEDTGEISSLDFECAAPVTLEVEISIGFSKCFPWNGLIAYLHIYIFAYIIYVNTHSRRPNLFVKVSGYESQ